LTQTSFYSDIMDQISHFSSASLSSSGFSSSSFSSDQALRGRFQISPVSGATGRTFYVSGKGSDRRNGLSPQTAFRTLQRAANLTQPGDQVLVMNGTYRNPNPRDNVLTIRRSGNAQNWITYRAYPGHRPLLQARNWHGISIQGASYITVSGFRLVGNLDQIRPEQALAQRNNLNNPLTSGNGIGISPLHRQGSKIYPRHVRILNNRVSKFGGGGIYTFNADYVTIEDNVVSETSYYSPYANSGISLYQSWNSDQAEGYKMQIRRNLVYRNQNLVPFYRTGRVSDGNGIIVDDHRNTQLNSPLGPYRGKTLVENNIVYQNGGRGIHIYKSDAVDILNNTSYQNSRHPQIQDGEITVNTSSQVRVLNNILYSRSGRPANGVSQAPDAVYSSNLIFNATQFMGAAERNLFANPRFVNPRRGNFNLRPNSPAINAGSQGLGVSTDRFGRARGDGRVDIGAIEFGRNSLIRGTESRVFLELQSS
jgi:parallel beta-helix repeat protein